MQDPYPATFQRRHHNISLGAVFFSLHVNNNLSKAAIKSDLFSSGSITNPNTCTVPFSLVNGWHSAITNVPDAAKGKYSILFNIWEYGPSSTGNLTSNHMQALIIEKGGGIFTRLYINSAWSDWA